MRTKSFEGMACQVAGAIEAIGDRWSFLILRDLALWPCRFDDFKEFSAIPNTTLSQRLRHLQAHGLVERRPYQDNPPRSEYVLTAKGRDLWMVLLALGEWGERWNASGAGGATIHMVDGKTGRRVKLALEDATTGRRVPLQRLRPRAGPTASEALRRKLKQHEKKALS
jgi:DNA-binding HxlR family transcriptional regulator